MKLGAALYYGDFVAAPLAGAAALTASLWTLSWPAAALTAVGFGIGLIVWTMLEYAVHAWLYHRVDWFARAHQAHHDDPKSLIGAPSLLIVAIILAFAYAPVMLAGAALCGGLAAGTLAGYFAYMTVHHLSHHGRPGPLLNTLRARHLAHHYRGGDTHFGIVTDIWDRVFETTGAATRPSLR